MSILERAQTGDPAEGGFLDRLVEDRPSVGRLITWSRRAGRSRKENSTEWRALEQQLLRREDQRSDEVGLCEVGDRDVAHEREAPEKMLGEELGIRPVDVLEQLHQKRYVQWSVADR